MKGGELRRYLSALVVVVALAIPAVAIAATLETGKFGDLISEGDKCANGAYYHFVLNQVSPDYKPGVELVTAFVEPDGQGGWQPAAQYPDNPVLPEPVLKHVQHFRVFSTGMLDSATTDATYTGGKLVLSDVSCKKD